MNITIKGHSFEVAAEPANFWGWIEEGRYDPEFNLMERYLKPEHTFIDLGAWVGSHSLYASTIAKRVISIEPDPVAFPILEVNAGRRAEIHRLAIMGYAGTVKLGSGYLGASTTRANPLAGGKIGPWEDGHTFDIECTTLSQFCADIPDPLFIKMDVEGAEEEILQDRLFQERKPLLLLETHPYWWKDIPATWELVHKANPLNGF